nr:unnamed protein product [Callosobruchus analis]
MHHTLLHLINSSQMERGSSEHTALKSNSANSSAASQQVPSHIQTAGIDNALPSLQHSTVVLNSQGGRTLQTSQSSTTPVQHSPCSSSLQSGGVSQSSQAGTSLSQPMPSSSSFGAMTSRTPNKISYSTVLLSTAIVEIRYYTGQFQKVRVLFDSGSMANFISEKCANRLDLARRHL